MASSRKERPNTVAEPASIERALIAPITQCLDQLPQAGDALAVALSGGPDSAALAICAQRVARQRKVPLHLFHVHHGLQKQADDWQTTVKALAELLDCSVHIRRVQVDLASGKGLEAAARTARHAALREMASEADVRCILMAHHQQDQAETVLMRLLRGAGVGGLAAMAWARQEGELFWVRPWLDLSKDCIVRFVTQFSDQTGWTPVQDPSNQDESLARGILRQRIMPVIADHWPNWAQTLSRHARQAAQADELLSRYGELLLRQVSIIDEPGANAPPKISLPLWRGLAQPEQVLVLRIWLSDAGALMPTQSRLAELIRQLRQVHAMGHDRDLTWQQKDCTVRCIGGQLQVHVKI